MTGITALGTRHVARTTPYAWPYDGVLDATRTVALSITAPGAPSAANEAEVEVTTSLTARGGVSIGIATRTRSLDRPVRGAGAAPVQHRLDAEGIDGFTGSGLEALLRRLGTRRILLTGAWLETSVHSTMRTANDMGFECLLVVDACIPGDPELVGAAVSMIEMSGGIFGAVGRSADVIAAYSGT